MLNTYKDIDAIITNIYFRKYVHRIIYIDSGCSNRLCKNQLHLMCRKISFQNTNHCSAWVNVVPFSISTILLRFTMLRLLVFWRLSGTWRTGFYIYYWLNDLCSASMHKMKHIVRSINITKLLVQLFILRIPLISTSTLFDLHNKMIRGFLCFSARHKLWF